MEYSLGKAKVHIAHQLGSKPNGAVFPEAHLQLLLLWRDSTNCLFSKDYDSLALAISIARPKEGGVFYDLGSGVGKGVIAASLLHTFKICRGIELLTSLYQMSVQLREHIQQNAQTIREEMEKSRKIEYEFPQIEFINGDLQTVRNKNNLVDRLERRFVHFRLDHMLRAEADGDDEREGAAPERREHLCDADEEAGAGGEVEDAARAARFNVVGTSDHVYLGTTNEIKIIIIMTSLHNELYDYLK